MNATWRIATAWAFAAAVFAAPALVAAQDEPAPRTGRRGMEAREGVEPANAPRQGGRGPAVEEPGRPGRPERPEARPEQIRPERPEGLRPAQEAAPDAAEAEKALIDALMAADRDREAVERAVQRLRQSITQQARERVQERLAAAGAPTAAGPGGPAADRPLRQRAGVQPQSPVAERQRGRSAGATEQGVFSRGPRGDLRARLGRRMADIAPLANRALQRFAPPAARGGFGRGDWSQAHRGMGMGNRAGIGRNSGPGAAAPQGLGHGRIGHGYFGGRAIEGAPLHAQRGFGRNQGPIANQIRERVTERIGAQGAHPAVPNELERGFRGHGPGGPASAEDALPGRGPRGGRPMGN